MKNLSHTKTLSNHAQKLTLSFRRRDGEVSLGSKGYLVFHGFVFQYAFHVAKCIPTKEQIV
jgi:hypothetical protein